MADLPSKLFRMNLFQNGGSFGGEAKTVKLPSLKHKTEGYRGAGMGGEAKYRVGMDELKLEFTLGGLSVAALRSMGETRLDGTQFRFAGGYRRLDTGEVSAVEVVVHGQTNEVDMGDAEMAKDTEHKFVVDLVYYKLTIDGVDEVEIDILAGVEKWQGVDVNEALRAAAGG